MSDKLKSIEGGRKRSEMDALEDGVAKLTFFAIHVIKRVTEGVKRAEEQIEKEAKCQSK